MSSWAKCVLWTVAFGVGFSTALHADDPSVAESPKRDEQKDSVLNELKAKWEKQQLEQIVTAEFAVEYLRIQDSADKRISMKQMREYSDQVRFLWQKSSDPAQIRELSKALSIPQNRFPNCWLSGTILVRGDDLRNHFKADLVPGAIPEEYDTSFTHGSDVMYGADVKQASVFPTRSQWNKYGLSDMSIPPPFAAFEDKLILTEKKGDVVRLSLGPRQYEIDRHTGVVLQRLTNAGSPDVVEEWQYGFSEYVGGNGTKLIFPSITASITYVDERVITCFLFVIKSVRFNHELPADAFCVTVPAGTNVVLFTTREQMNPGNSLKTRETVKDVAALIPDLQPKSKQPKATQPLQKSSSLVWVQLVNGLGILMISLGVAVFFFWRRKRIA